MLRNFIEKNISERGIIMQVRKMLEIEISNTIKKQIKSACEEFQNNPENKVNEKYLWNTSLKKINGIDTAILQRKITIKPPEDFPKGLLEVFVSLTNEILNASPYKVHRDNRLSFRKTSDFTVNHTTYLDGQGNYAGQICHPDEYPPLGSTIIFGRVIARLLKLIFPTATPALSKSGRKRRIEETSNPSNPITSTTETSVTRQTPEVIILSDDENCDGEKEIKKSLETAEKTVQILKGILQKIEEKKQKKENTVSLENQTATVFRSKEQIDKAQSNSEEEKEKITSQAKKI